MPSLQIDGETIAEIDQVVAEQLLKAAKVKIGQVREPAGQGSVSTEMCKPSAPSVAITLTLDFVAPV